MNLVLLSIKLPFHWPLKFWALTEEIKQAAQLLGQSLRTNPVVESYLDLKTRAESDPETAALEVRMNVLYRDLSAREQAGESIQNLGSSEYFDLRKKARYHPILSAREDQLNVIKNIFAQTSAEMNAILGTDYITLATKME